MKKTATIATVLMFLLATTAMAQVDGKKRKGPARFGGRDFNPERMLKNLDKNDDGKLEISEVPERMKERFDRVDANGDGFVDAAELKKMFDAIRNRGGQPGGKPDGRFGKKGKPGDSDSPRPGNFSAKGEAGPGGKMFDLARLFKEADKDGDGNLNPAEQQAVIAKFKEFQERFRRMRGGNAPGKGGDRFRRPDTDPVKPKRPGKDD